MGPNPTVPHSGENPMDFMGGFAYGRGGEAWLSPKSNKFESPAAIRTASRPGAVAFALPFSVKFLYLCA